MVKEEREKRQEEVLLDQYTLVRSLYSFLPLSIGRGGGLVTPYYVPSESTSNMRVSVSGTAVVGQWYQSRSQGQPPSAEKWEIKPRRSTSWSGGRRTNQLTIISALESRNNAKRGG